MNTNIDNVPIPSSIDEITPAWVQEVTGDLAVVENFHVEGNIQEGIGFLSSICRVSYKTENGDQRGIIVKLLPTDPKWAEFAILDSSDEREMKFYSIVLPDLVEVIPEIQENVCKYYKGALKHVERTKGTKRESMLVMEDLKALGYKMMSFAGDASDRVLNDLLIFMARLHFGALAVEANKGISLPKLYPFMQGITNNEVWQSQMENWSEGGYEKLENLLSAQNISMKVWNRYEKLKQHTSKIVQKIDDVGRLNPCLIHGDVWPPNIQIHDSLPVKVLDWQLLGYRDVTYDLTIMLYTVLTKENLTKENLKQLIKRYYNEFERLCEDKGYGEKIKRRSWEEFEEFFFTWGAAFGYMICLPSIECYDKDCAKYANIFKFLCEEINIPEFLLKECA